MFYLKLQNLDLKKNSDCDEYQKLKHAIPWEYKLAKIKIHCTSKSLLIKFLSSDYHWNNTKLITNISYFLVKKKNQLEEH